MHPVDTSIRRTKNVQVFPRSSHTFPSRYAERTPTPKHTFLPLWVFRSALLHQPIEHDLQPQSQLVTTFSVLSFHKPRTSVGRILHCRGQVPTKRYGDRIHCWKLPPCNPDFVFCLWQAIYRITHQCLTASTLVTTSIEDRKNSTAPIHNLACYQIYVYIHNPFLKYLTLP